MSLRAQLIAALVGAVLLAGGAWWLHFDGYRQGVADTETAAKLAAYEQFQADVARYSAASYDLQNRLVELQNSRPKIITEYRNVMVENPLPATCRLDDGRLSKLNDAISAANAAGQSGAAVPGDSADNKP